jgi:CRISPR/Cas system CSM-associated protein Csm3 (group 7 of RAMP superfamily)
MEVLEEEELRVMREQQAHYEKMRNDEIAEAQKLEAIELRKMQEIERKKADAKLKKADRVNAHQKFESRQIAKTVLEPLKEDTIHQLN